MTTLSKLERKILHWCVMYREKTPTMWGGFRANLVRYAILFGLVGVCITAALLIEQPQYAWAFAGLLVGCFARDLGQFRMAGITWPVTRSVIDWSKVEHLLADDLKPKSNDRQPS